MPQYHEVEVQYINKKEVLIINDIDMPYDVGHIDIYLLSSTKQDAKATHIDYGLIKERQLRIFVG